MGRRPSDEDGVKLWLRENATELSRTQQGAAQMNIARFLRKCGTPYEFIMLGKTNATIYYEGDKLNTFLSNTVMTWLMQNNHDFRELVNFHNERQRNPSLKWKPKRRLLSPCARTINPNSTNRRLM